MSFVAVAGAAVAAGGAIYASNKQSKAAKAAGKDASANYAAADSILSQAQERTLTLPEFHAVDETGKFLPDLFDVFDELGRVDASGNPLPDLINEISRSFSQDVTNAQRLLPAVGQLSEDRQREATRLYDQFLEQNGFATGQRSATEALNSFLNFELPENARREINRRSSEVALRSGTLNSGPQLDVANTIDFDTRVRNFFAALPQANNQILQKAQFIQPGLDTSFLPAGGTSLAGAQGNFQLRSQSALLNYQNALDQNINRFNLQLTERLSNFQRQDEFAMLRANILTDKGNASQTRANALSSAASQTLATGFSAAGQAIGGIDLQKSGQALQGLGTFLGADPRAFQQRQQPLFYQDPALRATY